MLLSYHNSPALKAKYLARVQDHRRKGRLVQGVGWLRDKGCAVGCTLGGYDPSRYPLELGVPEQLAYLEDQLFELLPAEEAMQWPEHFLTAIPVGVDLSGVWPAWAIWMLVDPVDGVRYHVNGFPARAAAILRVAELCGTGGTLAQFEEAGAAAWVAGTKWTGARGAGTATLAAASAACACTASAAPAANAAVHAANTALFGHGMTRAEWARKACAKLSALFEQGGV